MIDSSMIDENGKLTKITSKVAKAFRGELQAELSALLDNYGLSLDLGNATYDDDYVHFKGFKIRLKGSDDEHMKELKYMSNVCGWEWDYDKVATDGHYEYKLVGYNSRKKTNKFLFQRLDNMQKYYQNEATAKHYFLKN